jgi:hypothetical protein
MREAKQQRHHVVLVRDRLFIDGEQYIPPEDRPVNVDNVCNSPPHLQQVVHYLSRVAQIDGCSRIQYITTGQF